MVSPARVRGTWGLCNGKPIPLPVQPLQLLQSLPLRFDKKRQVTRIASCRLSSSLSTMLQCLGPFVRHSSFSSSLSPDSDEESCSQPALTLTFIFKLLAPRVFGHSGSSADAELVEGVWPNQEPLSLSARFFFFAWQNWAFSFFFGPGFFFFFTQGLFSAFEFSIGVIVKSFHLGIFVKCVM